MPTPAKCVNPRGARYCADPNCPARDENGNHIVATSLGNDLTDGLKLNKPAPTVPQKPYTPPKQTQLPLTPVKPHETDVPLFDDDSEWVEANISFYVDAVGVNPLFYCDPKEDYTIVAKISYERKKDIYIICKGNMRVQYGTHIIRSSKQLKSIGINTDMKLRKAVEKNLITVLQEPKFEAVHIRYLGRKDETRTTVSPASPYLHELIFTSVKNIQQ